MGLFRKNDEEIDRAFQQVLEILRRGLEEIETKEEATHKEPENLVKGEDKPLIEPLKIADFLDPVAKELDNLEKILAKVRPKIDSISRLMPRLNEMKTLLEKDIHTRQVKATETKTLIQNLEKQIKPLREDIDRKSQRIDELQTQINQEKERIAHIEMEMPKLKAEKQMNEAIIAQEEEGVRKVEGNINRILSLQNLNAKDQTEHLLDKPD